ncbi:hypothetical protein FRC07_009101, partial [Ceratobasidium sp. 392]
MPRRLPIELLTLVANFASQSTLGSFSLASKATYTVSLRPLYAHIPRMNGKRTVRCLTTLVANARLALLVQSYHMHDSEESFSHDVHELVASAFENMTGLTELRLWFNIPLSPDIFEHAKFKLHTLEYWVMSGSRHSIAEFLNTQSELKSLHLFCHNEDELSSLAPTALPALRDVGGRHYTLRDLLPTRLSHITHVLSIGNTSYDLRCLITFFRDAPTRPTTLIEFELGLNLGDGGIDPGAVKSALSKLGYRVPWIGSLRLKAVVGRFERDFLLNYFTVALRHYPSLHTFSIATSSQPETDAY